MSTPLATPLVTPCATPRAGSRASRGLSCLLAALLVALVVCGPARAAFDDEDEYRQVFLSKEQALAHVFPDAEHVVELRHVLSAREIAGIERHLGKGRTLAEGGFYLYAAWDEAPPAGRAPAGEPDGYAVIVMEVGKVMPITHIVGVRPGDDGAEAGRVAVMIYRESHGAEVAGERFMQQYEGMTLDDPIRVNRDVIHIAGATLSAHAICRGVRKALGAVQVVLLDRPASERARLLAGGEDVTPARRERSGEGPRVPAAEDTSDARASSGPPAPQADVLAERRVMGTLARVHLPADPAGGLDGAARAAAAQAALDTLAHWDAVLSDWNPDTPLSRFNAAPVGRRVALDADLAAWLEHADRLVRATGGAFDPAVGSLVDAWGLRTRAPARPTEGLLAAARAGAGWTHLGLELGRGEAVRGADGLRLDPGASGKGFALDRAADVLRAHGVRAGLLSFRSTLLALGAPAGSEGFAIPVRHDGAGRDVTVIRLADAALSVSGGAAAGFDDGDVRRGHVLDPRAGLPLPVGRQAWVVADSAADADALSTALLVAGRALPAFRGADGVVLARGGWLADGDAPVRDWPALDALAARGPR